MRTKNSYNGMKQRCLNKNNKSYHRYGGRGISVCDRWLESYQNFLGDMGERPDGMSIDRIDNNGNYEPSNCRWATPSQQSQNSSLSKLSMLERSAIKIMYNKYNYDHDKLTNIFGVSKQTIKSVAKGNNKISIFLTDYMTDKLNKMSKEIGSSRLDIVRLALDKFLLGNSKSKEVKRYVISQIGDGSIDDMIEFMCYESVNCRPDKERCDVCAFKSSGSFKKFVKQEYKL